MRKHSRARVTAGIIGLAVVLSACGSPAPVGSPPATQSSPTSASPASVADQLIAAAKAANENELNVTWSPGVFGGASATKDWQSLFNRTYGLNITLQYTPGPGFPDMAARLLQELAAGQKSSTDLLLGDSTTFASLLDRDALEPYDYARLSRRVTAEMIVPKNIGVDVNSRLVGLIYNSSLVPADQVPKRLEDLLDPRLKGKIAASSAFIGFTNIALLPGWGADKMKAFATKLSGQLGGIIGCTDLQRLVSGEFALLALCPDSQVRREQQKGAPLAHQLLEDGATLTFWHMGVPRNSAHPNLAKLFIDLVLSTEGQALLYKTDFSDLATLSGSRSAGQLKDLAARGIRPLRVDVKLVAEHPEINRLTAELRDILRTQR